MSFQFSNCSSNLTNVLVIIPVRDEELTIGNVVQELRDLGLTKIRVVDNGSSDRSAEVARAAGAEVVSEPRAGYGRACWRGLQELDQEIEWILFVDGDGSDDLSCLPDFWRLRTKSDLILGDRRATAQGKAVMSPVQHFGNGLASWLIRWGWGYQYHDLGPLRLIRRSALEQIGMKDRGFGWTVEMQVRAVEEGLKISELPVNYRPRQGGKSKISGTISGSIQAGVIILSTIGKLYLFSGSGNQEQEASGKNQLYLWLATLCLFIGAVIMMPYGDFRQPVINFAYGLGLMELGFILAWRIKSLNCWWFWLVAIALRLIMLGMYPGSDIWRYIWEGQIQNLGFNPYNLAPNAPELVPYRSDWWSQINHKSVSAIYPPLSQVGFRLLAALSPTVIAFKLSFAIADLLTCWLLTKRFSYGQTLVYAWNPLILYSFAGGGHYDSWFILPLVAAWIWGLPATKNYQQSKYLLQGCLVGMSIAIKWISLPILGFVSWIAWRKASWKLAVCALLCGMLPFIFTALMFCDTSSCHLVPTGSRFVQQARIAEFFPYLLAKVWQGSTNTNSIFAPILMLSAIALLLTAPNLQQFALGWFASLYLVSPIIHVWYLTWIVPFAVGTNNWGVRLLSVSGCIYFVIPFNGYQRNLTDIETWLLWLPFIVGYGWSLSMNNEQ
ncbi:MAG: glycosyltransferase family 2 protein [Cyanobacteria bacterium J06621_8]